MKYSEATAVGRLERNGVEIEERRSEITGKVFHFIHLKKNQIGINLWGAVDFLTKVHNYSVVMER